MPSPFDDPERGRRHRHRRHRSPPPAVAVKLDYPLLALWSALFVLFMVGAVAALLR